jgi:hypothetical protein
MALSLHVFFSRYIHNKFLFIKGINMFNKVTKLLATIALTGWMSLANATLIFDFSWDSEGGKISGEILGLVDNTAQQVASAVIVNSINGAPVFLDFLVDTSIDPESISSFAVSDGVITDYNFYGFFSGRTLDIYKLLAWAQLSGGGEGFYHARSDSTVEFVNRVTVPEPGSVILVLLGLAGLSFARYRKQS